MVVGAASRHRATLGRVGRDGDGVAVKAELGDVVARAGGGEGVGSFGGDYLAVLGPVDEGVSLVGRGFECDRRSGGIGARSGYGAALGGIGRGGDVVLSEVEVCNIFGILGNGEAEGGMQ